MNTLRDKLEEWAECDSISRKDALGRDIGKIIFSRLADIHEIYKTYRVTCPYPIFDTRQLLFVDCCDETVKIREDIFRGEEGYFQVPLGYLIKDYDVLRRELKEYAVKFNTQQLENVKNMAKGWEEELARVSALPPNN